MKFEEDRGSVVDRITREELRCGSELAAVRARAAPDIPIRSDQEIGTSLEVTLAGRPKNADIWVFGYGSLIWNPTIEYAEKRPALLRGWHRRFCLSSTGRGTRESPGIMLALDRGASCLGVAFRLNESQVYEELFILWRREMLSGSYQARWLSAQTAEGGIPILTFVANHNHPRFAGNLSDAEVTERIAFARGPLGSCLEYFRNTVAALDALGSTDASLKRIGSKVEARLKQLAAE